MAFIGEKVRKTLLDELLLAAGFILMRMGKVRNTYEIPNFPKLLLMLVTDRISIFDFVLGFLIPGKGESLVALTIFFHQVLQAAGIKTHLVAYGSEIDQYLPEELRGNPELQKRAIIVKKLKMIPMEAIIRGFLTGSGWKAYLKNDRVVCGILLPEGLHDGSELPDPTFTPTTKAEGGHDEHMNADEAAKQYSWLPDLAIRAYMAIQDYARKLGILLADTKFEIGIDPDTGEYVLGDEFGTPDSSRWWLLAAWLVAAKKKKAPAGWDKEPVRQEGKQTVSPFDGMTIDQLDPDNEAHVHWAAEVVFSDSSIRDATRRYITIVELLTGRSLANFQREVMNITEEEEPIAA